MDDDDDGLLPSYKTHIYAVYSIYLYVNNLLIFSDSSDFLSDSDSILAGWINEGRRRRNKKKNNGMKGKWRLLIVGGDFMSGG